MREGALGRARRAARAKSRSAWRAEVLERDDWMCRLTGSTDDDWHLSCQGPLHAHHVLPRSRGGKDDLGNGLTLCSWHHTFVHSHPDWAIEHGYLLKTPPSVGGLK